MRATCAVPVESKRSRQVSKPRTRFLAPLGDREAKSESLMAWGGRGEYREAAGATTPDVARRRRLIDAGLFSCDRIFRRLSFASRRLAISRQSIWRLGCGDRDWCCAVDSGLNRGGTNFLTGDEARRIASNIVKLPNLLKK